MARIIALGTSPSGMSFKLVPFVARADGQYLLYGMTEEPQALTEEQFTDMVTDRRLLLIRQTSERWQPSGAGGLITSTAHYDWTGIDMELPRQTAALRFEPETGRPIIETARDSQELTVAVWLGKRFEEASVGLNVMDEQTRARMTDFVFAEVEGKPNAQASRQYGILALMKHSDASDLVDGWLQLPLALAKQALSAPDFDKLPDNAKTVTRQLAILISNTPPNSLPALSVRMKAVSVGLIPGGVEKELDFQLAVNRQMVEELWLEMLSVSFANIQTVDQIIEAAQASLPEMQLGDDG